MRQRRKRRTLRRAALIVAIGLAVAVGLIDGLPSGMGMALMSVGRALAALALMGLAGIMIGVLLTTLAVLVYNGIFSGSASLIDLEYIDEVPLAFAAIAGVLGIFWSPRWPDLVGLLGWGLVLLVANELLFPRPGHETRR